MSFDPYNDYGLLVPFALVIKTDMYAGNFEREMCTWITGYEGEYYPGGMEYLKETALKELGKNSDMIIDYLGLIPHDEYNDVRVIMTGKEYKSVAILFNEKPPLKLINLMAERAKNFTKAYKENAKTKSYIDLKKFQSPKILSIKFETYKVTVKKTEIVL